MPFEVTDNVTGKTLVFENKPSDLDMEEAFGSLAPSPLTSAQMTPVTTGQADVAGTMDKPMAWSDVGKQAIANIPESAGEAVSNIYQTFRHPVQTVKGVGKIALGAMQKIIPGIQSNEKHADAIGQFFLDRYGSIENFKKTLSKDPIGVAMDASTVVTGIGGGVKALSKVGQLGVKTSAPIIAGGKGVATSSMSSALNKTGEILQKTGQAIDPINIGIGVTKPIVKAGGKVIGQTLGVSTGAGYNAIKEAIKGNKNFTQTLRGGIKGEDILDEARVGLQSIKDARSSAYISKLDDISKIKTQLDITPIQRKTSEMMKGYNIKLKPITDNAGNIIDYTYDFSRSTLNKNAHADMAHVIDIVRNWGKEADDLTPKGLDILKRQLDDFYSESKNSRAFVSSVRNEVKNVLTKEVPEYGNMVKGYEEASNLINELERSLSLGNKAQMDTAIRKLTSAVRERHEFRKSLVDIIDTQSGTNLASKIAGYEMSTIMPRGLRSYGLLAGEALALMTAWNPVLVGIMMTNSPRFTGELLNAVGKAVKAERAISGKMPKGTAKGAFQAGRANEQVIRLDANGNEQ